MASIGLASIIVGLGASYFLVRKAYPQGREEVSVVEKSGRVSTS